MDVAPNWGAQAGGQHGEPLIEFCRIPIEAWKAQLTTFAKTEGSILAKNKRHAEFAAKTNESS